MKRDSHVALESVQSITSSFLLRKARDPLECRSKKASIPTTSLTSRHRDPHLHYDNITIPGAIKCPFAMDRDGRARCFYSYQRSTLSCKSPYSFGHSTAGLIIRRSSTTCTHTQNLLGICPATHSMADYISAASSCTVPFVLSLTLLHGPNIPLVLSWRPPYASVLPRAFCCHSHTPVASTSDLKLFYDRAILETISLSQIPGLS